MDCPRKLVVAFKKLYIAAAAEVIVASATVVVDTIERMLWKVVR